MIEKQHPGLIFHMCREDEWQQAETCGQYDGSSQDVSDGFIHFSTAGQVRESAAKHRAGQSGLLLLGVDPGRLPKGALVWESSRGGQLFPHLYDSLPVSAAVCVDPLPLDENGLHAFPAGLDIGDGGNS